MPGSFTGQVAQLVLDDGTLAGTAGGGFTSSGTTLLRNGTVSAALGGSGGVQKEGTGTVALQAANGYGGLTRVLAGRLVAADNQALGSTTNGTEVAATAVLEIAGAALGNEAVALAGTLEGTGTASLAGPVTLAGASRIGGTGVLSLGGSIGEASAGQALTKTGSNELRLNGSTAYSGATQVQQGTLTLGPAVQLAGAAPVSIDAGATLALGGNQQVGSLVSAGRLAGTGTLSAPSYRLDSGAQVDANLGAGTLTSTGNATLAGTAGATTVNVTGGRLTLAAPERLADTAALAVAGGAVLALNGTETSARSRWPARCRARARWWPPPTR